MSTHTVLIIFDDGLGRWGPLCDLRPSFDLRTGAWTNRRRIEDRCASPAGALWTARDALVPLLRARQSVPVNDAAHLAALNDGDVLCVNGRWLAQEDAALLSNLQCNQALVQSGGHVVAARLRASCALSLLERGALRDDVKRIAHDDAVLIDRPWHLLDHLQSVLPDDLSRTAVPRFDQSAHGSPAARTAMCFGDHPIHIADDVTLQPGVVLNSEAGAIVIERGALVGALAILEGPCYIGARSQVAGHAHIRPYTSIGSVCKAAGEISHTIMHSYTNKGHHGYLGHAIIGRWVNIGAATNVSNLKNTYGSVRVQLECGEQPLDTARQFHGPIIGDFVRTGISTRLLTGTVIGTGSMVAVPGFAPRHVQRFSFLTDRGQALHDPDRLITTIERMMARRDRTLCGEVEKRLRAIATDQAPHFNAA